MLPRILIYDELQTVATNSISKQLKKSKNLHIMFLEDLTDPSKNIDILTLYSIKCKTYLKMFWCGKISVHYNETLDN